MAPKYSPDVNGTRRFTGDIYAEKIGIGTTIPSSVLEIVDGDIAITSTDDAKTWKFDYADESNSLILRENGSARMVFANGGNITIGSGAPTAKLTVVRGTTTTQLKYHTASVALGATFSVTNGGCSTANASLSVAEFTTTPTVTVGNLTGGTGDESNGCNVAGFNFPARTFSAIPSVAVGNKTAGATFDQRLTLTVESVTGEGTSDFAILPQTTYRFLATATPSLRLASNF